VKAALPHRLLAFYGDDFTGSTDTMEVLAMAGLAPVLFLDRPDAEAFARFPEARAIGIAGISRSQPPEWMDAELPALFTALRDTGAPIIHYKLCSTFDSAPDVGNIGRAAEIGASIFGNRPMPLLVGAPALRRYVAFGTLFAGYGPETFRIDRHPVMRRHPVTPMDEADLRLHLARQTTLSVGLLDLPHLANAEAVASESDLLLFDTVDEASLRQAGTLLWRLTDTAPIFALGSSGLEYALVAAWRAAGLLPEWPSPAGPTPVDRLLAISGSCSPLTERQIHHAIAHGFADLRLDARRLVEDSAAEEAAVQSALDALAEGRDALLYTAAGPQDPAQVALSGAEGRAFNDRLGAALGRILREILTRSGLRRAVVAGGDTSSHAMRQLSLQALTFAASLVPGCPLCLTHAAEPALAGLEIALKGGQMGGEDFFTVLRGGPKANTRILAG
jgi:uncharacterized protein YgbK (DUF1537 family)